MSILPLTHESETPLTPVATTAILFSKTIDKDLYYKNETGIEYNLTNPNWDIYNRVSNPNGTIHQRNSGATKTHSAGSGVTFGGPDRWHGGNSGSGAFTLGKETTNGEDNLLISCTTADTSIASGDWYFVGQAIEGNNFYDFKWGTSDAKYLVLSFEVKCSITGTFPVFFRNSAANRSYVSLFTVETANTWETKTIVIPGDVTGTWVPAGTNPMALNFGISLASGTSVQGTPNTWTAANRIAAASYTNFMNSNTNTMRLRKFGIYPGRFAPPFANRRYDIELMHCKRYFQVYSGNSYGTAFSGDVTSGNFYYAGCFHQQELRASPGFTYSSQTGYLFTGTNTAIGGLTTTLFFLYNQATGSGAGGYFGTKIEFDADSAT